MTRSTSPALTSDELSTAASALRVTIAQLEAGTMDWPSGFYASLEEAEELADRLETHGSDLAFSCIDCRENTSDMDEYYMVRDAVWRAATGEIPDGMLCVGCLEARLGRRLDRTDFVPAPINDVSFDIVGAKSPRLRNRITRAPRPQTQDSR